MPDSSQKPDAKAIVVRLLSEGPNEAAAGPCLFRPWVVWPEFSDAVVWQTSVLASLFDNQTLDAGNGLTPRTFKPLKKAPYFAENLAHAVGVSCRRLRQ